MLYLMYIIYKEEFFMNKPKGLYFPTQKLDIKDGIVMGSHTSYTFMWDYWIYKTSTHFEQKEQNKEDNFMFTTSLA